MTTTTISDPAMMEELRAAARQYRAEREIERRAAARLARPRSTERDEATYESELAACREAEADLVAMLRATGLRAVVCDGYLFVDASPELADQTFGDEEATPVVLTLPLSAVALG